MSFLASFYPKIVALEERVSELYDVSGRTGVPDAEIRLAYVRHMDGIIGGNHRQELEKLLHEADTILDCAEGGRLWFADRAGVHLRGYRSTVDGSLQPYGVRVPEPLKSHGKQPLTVELHGHMGYDVTPMQFAGRFSGRQNETVTHLTLEPFGRGNSRYQGLGEQDVFEVLELVCTEYGVDPDRIFLSGGSMGGAGTWFLGSHYPDRWAAVAPVAGYCDHRIWLEQNNDADLPDWEHVVRESTGAVYLAENFTNLPVFCVHGAEDDGSGGSVSVEHSRRIVPKLKSAGVDITYTEYPDIGHFPFPEEMYVERDRWFETYTRDLFPKRVVYSTYSLRFSRAYWVQITRLEKSNHLSRVEATVADAPTGGTATVAVTTSNISGLSLSLTPELISGSSVELKLDGQAVWSGEPVAEAINVHSDVEGLWEIGTPDGSYNVKLPGRSGPMWDGFGDPFICVFGTGNPSRTAANLIAAQRDMEGYGSTHGGLLCGNPIGKLFFSPRIVADCDLTENEMAHNNLVCYGRPNEHLILKDLAGDLPVKITDAGVVFRKRIYTGSDIGISCILPSPLRRKGYLVINAAPDSETLKAIAGWQWRLPDYAIFRPGRLESSPPEFLDAGFFNETWE